MLEAADRSFIRGWRNGGGTVVRSGAKLEMQDPARYPELECDIVGHSVNRPLSRFQLSVIWYVMAKWFRLGVG